MKKFLLPALLLLLPGCACQMDAERHETISMAGKAYPFENVDQIMKDAKQPYAPKSEPILAWPWAEQ